MLTKNAPRAGGVVEARTNTYDQPRSGFYNVGYLTTASMSVGGVLVASQTFVYAAADLARSARLRSLGSRMALRRRIDLGVTSTSSSSSI